MSQTAWIPFTADEVAELAAQYQPGRLVEQPTLQQMMRLFATIFDLQRQIGLYATVRRGHEREDLEAAGIEALTCSKDFILCITDERDELRRLVMPETRPTTIRDYLAPIMAYLDGRADVEEDAKTENDEARVLCWLRDALAAERSEQLRRSEEILKTGAAKAGSALIELRRRNDQLLDQLRALLPDRVDAYIAYIAALPWSADATDKEKTLAAGHLHAFAAHVRSASPIPMEEEDNDRT